MKHTYLKQTLIAILASSTLPAFADDQEPLHATLDPLVVTFGKNAQPLSKTPARVSRISLDDIQANPTLNLSDVLQKDASVYIKQNGGIGQGASLHLRGGDETHTLLLKDGIRLNTQNGFSPIYPEQIDLTDISQIEIVKGASSVQYGTDAISGTIQLRSLTPTKTSAFFTGVLGENQTYKTIIGGSLVHDGFYAQLHGQRLKSDGTRILNTQDKQDKAGFDQKGYNAKFGYKQDNFHANIAFGGNQGTNVYMNYASRKNTEQRHFKNKTFNAQAEYQPTNGLILNAQYTEFKDTQTWVDGTTTPYTPNNKNTDINITAKWDFSPEQNLLVGIARQNAEYATATSQADKKDMSSTGYFAQHQYNSQKLNTQVGIRLERHENFGNHTVGQGAVRYHISKDTSIFANIGSSFKAPYLDELHSRYGGNTELKPEKGISYEFGADHYLLNNTKVYASIYQNNINNLINYDGIALKQMNIDKAKMTGGELGVKWTHNDFFINGEYAHVKTENKSANTLLKGKALPYRPKHTLTLTGGMDNGAYGANISLTAYGKSYADRPNTSTVAGYTTVNLAGYWNATPNIKLFTNIQNVGNTTHNVVKDGNDWYINDGRQANIGITLSY